MISYINFKRLIDFGLSLIALLILWPVFLVIAFLIKLDSKGPVFFIQKRVGKNKRYFCMYKFRTMKINTPKDMPKDKLKNPDALITRTGKVLRRTSLDELPQIINILKGEMSIIGPRPSLCNQYDLIAKRDKYGANDISPGLTGWAQINGRDEITLDDKVRLDGEYVKKQGFIIDVKIFFKTGLIVLRSEGIKEGALPTDINKEISNPLKRANF